MVCRICIPIITNWLKTGMMALNAENVIWRLVILLSVTLLSNQNSSSNFFFNISRDNRQDREGKCNYHQSMWWKINKLIYSTSRQCQQKKRKRKEAWRYVIHTVPMWPDAATSIRHCVAAHSCSAPVEGSELMTNRQSDALQTGTIDCPLHRWVCYKENNVPIDKCCLWIYSLSRFCLRLIPGTHLWMSCDSGILQEHWDHCSITA